MQVTSVVPLLFFIGFFSLVTGVAMFVFSRILGVWFCRLGKSTLPPPTDSDLPKWLFRGLRETYDEQRAPARLRALGAVNIALGIGMLIVALLVG